MNGRLLAVAATVALLSARAAAQDLTELLNRSLDPTMTEAFVAGGPEHQRPSTPGFHLDAKRRLEFHARDMDVREVFEQLRLITRRNIVVDGEVDAQFSGDLYDMDFDQAMEAICLSTGLTATQRDGYLFVEKADMETRVFTLRYARAEDVKVMIEPLLEDGEKIGASKVSKQGIGSDPLEAGGDDYAQDDVIIVRAMPRNLEHIAALIDAVDAEPLQVMIEAVILTADMLSGHEHGVDVSALAGLTFAEAGATSNGFELLLPDQSGPILDDGFGRVESGNNSALSDQAFNFGFVKGNVAAFLSALDVITDTTVLANPKVLALNKQRGEVLLGRRDGFLTTTVTQTSSTQQVEYIETGTRLIFRPFIGDDGMIRLEIHPEDSEGGLNDDGLPFKETAELTTNILLRSGQTVFIGGLFREKTSDVETKVPLLGDIPVIRHAFRSVRQITQKEEIIILLTPRIVDRDSYGLEGGPGSPDAQRFQVPELRELYRRMAKALVLEGDFAAAMWLLEQESAGEAGDDPATRAALRKWLVPDFAGPEVDRRLLEDILAEEFLR